MNGIIINGIIGIGIGIITATSTLIGVYITQHFENKKRKSEEKRWYANFFLTRKIDALSNLYASLVDCYFTLNHYGNLPPKTYEEFKEKILSKEDAFLQTKALSSVYLDNKSKAIMTNVFGSFRQASKAIFLNLPDDECYVSKKSFSDDIRDINWNNFQDSYNKAVSCLENKLNPKILRHWEHFE